MLKEATQYIDLLWTLAGTILLGMGLGWLLDQWLGTRWLQMSLGIVFFVLAMVRLLRQLKRLENHDE